MNTTNAHRFKGVMTAIVTPFTSTGEVDTKAFAKLVNRQIEAGVDGIVVCGSTGEAMTMSEAERYDLVKQCVEIVQGKIPVIAGAGNCNTKLACEAHRKMKDLGADATLQVVPWYNKPSQEGLFEHFTSVAQAADLPVILYNIPSRTGTNLEAETVLRLAEACSNIVGLKDSNVEGVRIQSLIHKLGQLRPDFCVLSGEDGFVLPLLAMGGQGVISVSSNLAPKAMLDMVRAFEQGEQTKAAVLAGRLAELVRLMFFRTNPVAVKGALHLTGLVENKVRLPLIELNKADLAYLQKELTLGDWL